MASVDPNPTLSSDFEISVPRSRVIIDTADSDEQVILVDEDGDYVADEDGIVTIDGSNSSES